MLAVALPASPITHDVYMGKGLLEGVKLALKDYDEAIRLDPQYVLAYNTRGSSHNNLGQFQRWLRIR